MPLLKEPNKKKNWAHMRSYKLEVFIKPFLCTSTVLFSIHPLSLLFVLLIEGAAAEFGHVCTRRRREGNPSLPSAHSSPLHTGFICTCICKNNELLNPTHTCSYNAKKEYMCRKGVATPFQRYTNRLGLYIAISPQKHENGVLKVCVEFVWRRRETKGGTSKIGKTRDDSNTY